MATRTALSKKIRFEVFKRDTFTCQYCGQKAPEVILHVDHIDPVAAGGSNEIINLITSCFDCNSGKKDRKLDDNSVIMKQRQQLDLIAERREQLELMVEWKKSLASFDEDTKDIIVDYINTKIGPFILGEGGYETVSGWLKKFTISKILDGIDDSSKKYLKYDDGELSQDSVETFMNKTAAFIAVKEMPPIKQKIAYIKGIGRNRFDYWDEQKASIVLNSYTAALKNHGWPDSQILDDLEKEIIPRTKNAANWSGWKGLLEDWIEDIKKWKDKDENEISSSDRDAFYAAAKITEESLIETANHIHCSTEDRIAGILHIGSLFPDFKSEEFKYKMMVAIIDFLRGLESLYSLHPNTEISENDGYVSIYMHDSGLWQHFSMPNRAREHGVLHHLAEKVETMIEDILSDFYLPQTLYRRKDIDVLLKLHLDHYVDNLPF